MTAREAVMCCRKIGDRKKDERIFTAKIHGAEMKEDLSRKKVAFDENRMR